MNEVRGIKRYNFL